jgi:hypothetical protein
MFKVATFLFQAICQTIVKSSRLYLMTLMVIVLLEVAWIRCNCLYALTCFFLIEHRVNSVDVQRNKILTVCYLFVVNEIFTPLSPLASTV